MADFCHKYYLKKPKLLSIDIEGYEYPALASNDWENDKCIPEIIIIEINAVA